MNEHTNSHINRFNPSKEGISSNDEKRIYHYTSPQGLYKILDNLSIRFTDCQFLNDKSEYTHIEEPLEEAFKEIEKDLNNFKWDFFEVLNDNFEYDDFRITKTSSKFKINSTKKKYYVFCSSTIKDSLGMWNYYVKGGNYEGYNIGFSVNQLLNCFSTIENSEVEVFYGKVAYKEENKIEILKDLILEADRKIDNKEKNTSNFEEFKIVKQEIKGEVISYLENYRLFFKDEAFSNESEYRFVLRLPRKYTPNADAPIKRGFDVRNGIFTPFCVLSINKQETINSIMLSPMLESKLAKHGLKRFLKLNGYNNDKIAIEESKIPIRY